MIKFKDYSEDQLRKLDLRKVFGATVFGPIYTFNVCGQDIIDKKIYNKGTGIHIFKKSEIERRARIKCVRTKHYFTSPSALRTFITSHRIELKTEDWITKNCPLVKHNKNKIIVWSL